MLHSENSEICYAGHIHHHRACSMRTEIKECLFCAWNSETSRRMTESKLFFSTTQQVLEPLVVQIWYGHYKSLSLFLPNINGKVTLGNIPSSSCCHTQPLRYQNWSSENRWQSDDHDFLCVMSKKNIVQKMGDEKEDMKIIDFIFWFI